jgi:hypothetical protein
MDGGKFLARVIATNAIQMNGAGVRALIEAIFQAHEFRQGSVVA